ncbi:Transmembrane protein [Toxocara canis]|uniref:Transmembrane protein n=1 Tax=Toxocara canis TaxID=6265 RepID=A0A0B2UID7_TOXCA|nr:Transmembrane protein [Toxocara canis]
MKGANDQSERQQKKFDKEKSDSNESQVNPTTSEHLQKSAANTVSQPVHDVFVQCNQSFRRTDRKRYEQMLKARKNEEEHVHNFESTEAALAVQTFFHNLSLICQGFLSGLSVAHAVFAFVFADVDTLSKGYDWIAMPVHATFYVCFVISTVSALDRHFGGHYSIGLEELQRNGEKQGQRSPHQEQKRHADKKKEATNK